MTTALEAAGVLRGRLAEAGLQDGRIDLPSVWSALKAWLCFPVEEDQDDASRLLLYLSQLPAAAGDGMTFAGEAPAAIAERDLFCVEIGRSFAQYVGPHSTEGIASAGIVLWFEASRDWRELSVDPDWIEMGVSTPNLDWAYPFKIVEEFIADLERSRVLAVAFDQPPLALEIYDSEQEDATLYLQPAPRA